MGVVFWYMSCFFISGRRLLGIRCIGFVGIMCCMVVGVGLLFRDSG